MSYICKNLDCCAPENKKGKAYPSAMECPFCDEPLVEDISLNDNELELINSLPYVIAYPLRKTTLFEEPEDISALDRLVLQKIYIQGCKKKKSDFLSHLQSVIDW